MFTSRHIFYRYYIKTLDNYEAADTIHTLLCTIKYTSHHKLIAHVYALLPQNRQKREKITWTNCGGIIIHFAVKARGYWKSTFIWF